MQAGRPRSFNPSLKNLSNLRNLRIAFNSIIRLCRLKRFLFTKFKCVNIFCETLWLVLIFSDICVFIVCMFCLYFVFFCGYFGCRVE
ncbi:MAG: hypothetical protein LBP59_09755 [Planctomycetaceae bacterium]|nr:hypothetical protein [Planctomycetaceae bacterium]